MAQFTETIGNHTFHLGEDEHEAKQRAIEIWKLKADEAALGKHWGWTPLGLSLAKKIAIGVTVFDWPPDEAEEATPEEYVEIVDGIQRYFPSVTFVPSDAERYTEGGGDIETIQRRLEEQETLRLQNTESVTLSRIYQLLKEVHQKTVSDNPSSSIENLSVTQWELYTQPSDLPTESHRLITKDQLEVDSSQFEVRYRDQPPLFLGNTKLFHLLKRLAKRPGIFLSFDTLRQDVWGDELVESATISRTVRSLRDRFRKTGFEGITLDTSQPHHVRLLLNGE